MRKISGMDDEIRRLRQRIDLVNGGPQRSRNVGIRRLTESHMAVTDLDEAEPGRIFGMGLAEDPRTDGVGPKSPYDAGPCPCHALKKAAAIDTVVLMIVNDCVFQNELLHAIPSPAGVYSRSEETIFLPGTVTKACHLNLSAAELLQRAVIGFDYRL